MKAALEAVKLESYLESFKVQIQQTIRCPPFPLESYLESFKENLFQQIHAVGAQLESYLESFKETAGMESRKCY